MKTIKIAIADDHILFRQGIISLLNEQPNIKVILEAGNGLELMDQLERKRPDLILMDIQMPVMDGVKATKLIGEKYPEIKIVILSMYDNKEMALHLLENGASGFLPKSTDVELVIHAIYETIKNGYYMSEATSLALISKGNKGFFEAENKLTERETEIVRLICKQQTHTEIAEQLNLSTRTIESHKKNILKKTQSRNTAGIVLYAIKNNLLSNIFQKFADNGKSILVYLIFNLLDQAVLLTDLECLEVNMF